MKKIICLSLIFSLVFAVGCKKSLVKKLISNCEIIVEYLDGAIKGSVEYEYFLPSREIKKVIFNLYPNAFKEYDGCFTIKKVSVDKNDVEWQYIGETSQFLSIELPKRADSAEKVKIFIEFECILKECKQRLGIAGDVVNIAYFYPIPCVFNNGEYLMQPYVDIGDPFCLDFYNFDITFTLPSVFTIASGVTVKGIDILGEKTTYFCNLKNATNFACSLSEKYHVVSKKWGDKRVNYYFTQDEAAESKLELIINALDYFNEKIGNYAYDNFSIATSDYLLNGMEYSAFCVIKNGLNNTNFENAVVHEIAHQWIGQAVCFNEYESGYFDEGLTEFLTALYLADSKKEGLEKRINYAKILFNTFVSEQCKKDKNYKSVIKKGLNEFCDEMEYQILAYEKGFLFFNHLNDKLNGELIKYLTAFYKKHIFERVNEDDFINVFKSKRKSVKAEFDKIVFFGDNYFVA